MKEELQSVDLDAGPNLVDLVDEVAATRKACRLQRHVFAVALLSPARTRRRIRKGRPTSADDPIWKIIGMGSSDGPGDVSENVDRYLAEAYLDTHE